MMPRNRLLTISAIALLAILAAWGWMRKPSTGPAVAGSGAYTSAPPVAYDANGTPVAQTASNNSPVSNPNQTYSQPAQSNGTYSYGASQAAPPPNPANADDAYSNSAAAAADRPASYAGAQPAGPCVSPATYASAEAPAYASRGYVRTVHAAPVAESRYVERERAPVRAYTERSKKHSAMIVAGGAGTGAAIGALAGGGKGAGIGALAGGAGGFIYDRLTHKHRVR